MKPRRITLVGILVVFATLAGTSVCFAADNDLVLSRFATFDATEFSTAGDPCVNACGIVEPNRALFEDLVRDVGQVLAPRLANPAETLGEAGFAVNMMTSLTFIDNQEAHWQAVEDRSPPDAFFTGHLQVRKGLPFSLEIAGNLGYLFNSETFTLGTDLKWAVNEGFYYFPDLAFRGSVNTVMGSQDLNMLTAGGDISASKAFGISGVMQLTPFVGYQLLFVVASSRLLNAYPQDPRSPQFDTENPQGPGSSTFSPEFVFSQHDTQVNRFFVGTRMNVWILNFVLEAVFGDLFQATFSGGVDF